MSSAEHVHSVEADAGCLLTRRKNILKSWQDKVTRRWIWDRHNLFKGEAYLMIMTIKREAFWTPFLQTKTFKKKKGGWWVSGHESQKICHFWEFHKSRWINKRHKSRVTRIKKILRQRKLGLPQSQIMKQNGEREKKKWRRGSEKESLGRTKLQCF